MPNHVRNELILLAGDQAEFEKLIFNPETREVDFNVLVPMPQILRRVICSPRFGPNGRLMLEYTEEERSQLPPEQGSWGGREATPEEQAEIDQHKPNNWYDWAYRYWGTKWNAYDTDPGSYCFTTAWDAPRMWLEALHNALPKGMIVQCVSEFEGDEPTETFVMESRK